MPSKINSYLSKPSVLVIIAISCFSIVTMDGWRNWHKGQHPFSWDVANYYSYLPAHFLNDGSYEFNNPNFVDNYLPICPIDNKHIPKTTYGMSLMYSPFFALGYKVALNQNDPRDGFSEPFATVIHWGMIFYGLLSLFILRSLLRKFFSELVTSISIIIVFLGTSLFYYSVSMPEMSHSALFLLYSSFLLATCNWHENQKLISAIVIGFLIGLISLIRPTDILIAMFFVFWPKHDISNIKERFSFWFNNWKSILLIILTSFLIWLPQMLFWKFRTGQLLYFSYGDEGFFWGDPQVINVLFSYRKGLFVYTPLFLLAFIGLFFMKANKTLRNLIIVSIVLTTYLISCWWDWFFGGSFAARAFVQHLAYMVIPIGYLIRYVFEQPTDIRTNTWIKPIFVIIAGLGISLNLFQTKQSLEGLIHFHSMSEKTYWLVFGKLKLNEHEQSEFWNSLDVPDYDKLKKGDRD
ncbi:MAG: hypothetical protein AB7O73_11340 [Bacteroidia bacterium]